LKLPFAVVVHPSGHVNLQLKPSDAVRDGLSELMRRFPSLVAVYAPSQLIDLAAGFIPMEGTLILGHDDIMHPSCEGLTGAHESDHVRRFYSAYRGEPSAHHGRLVGVGDAGLPHVMANLYPWAQSADEPEAFRGSLEDLLVAYLGALESNPSLDPCSLTACTVQGLETSLRNVLCSDRAQKAIRDGAKPDVAIVPEAYPDLPCGVLTVDRPSFVLVLPLLGALPKTAAEASERFSDQLAWMHAAAREDVALFRLAAMAQEQMESLPKEDTEGRRAISRALLSIVRDARTGRDPSAKAPEFHDVVRRFNQAVESYAEGAR
jgi:hypothetical protein